MSDISDYSDGSDDGPKYPAQPVCYICARDFSAPRCHYKYGPDAQWVSKYSGFCSDYDMERMKYWSNPSWRIFYRMILYNPENQQYHLSGAAQFPFEGRGHCIVPWDKDRGLLGYPNEVELLAFPKIADWSDHLEESRTLSGFLVHQICWKRLSRLIGRDAEKHLRCLSHILRSRPGLDKWKNKIPRGLKFYRTIDVSGTEKNIRTLIRQSRSRVENDVRTKMSPRAVTSRIPRLPLEIQYQIMDYLGGHSVLKVRQQLRWTLPNSYWRTRIDAVRYYEVDHISSESRDWEFLCLGLEDLTWRCCGRHDFMRVVRDIRSEFYRRLEKDD